VDLVRRAAPYVSKREITTGRHWTGLFEILNEAKGYTHLLDLGYDDVGFIPPASCYTPDLRGTGSPGDALLEVKTVNISDQDIQLFGTIQKARHGLPEGLQQKLASDFDKACEQLHSIPASDPVRRICYFCITLDLRVVLSDANKAELHDSLMSLQDRDCEIQYVSQHWTGDRQSWSTREK